MSDTRAATQRVLAELPNALGYFRIAGSIVMVSLAIGGQWAAMWSLLVLLLLSDLIDGKLARYFQRTSRYGALLDTAADLTMGGAIVLAMIAYAPETLWAYASWIVAAVGSYVLNVLLCAVRFRRFPSYHTWLAKFSWLFVILALVGLWAGRADWLIPLAAIVVLVTNVEGILITSSLPEYRVDVPSLFHVLS